MKKKQFNAILIVCIILIMIILTVVGFSIYENIINKNKEKINETKQQKTISICQNSEKGKYNCSNESNKQSNILTYTCVSETCYYKEDVNYYFEDNYVLIVDNNTYLINFNNKIKNSVSIDGNLVESAIINNDKIIGLVLNKNNKYGYYSYDKDKITIPMKYDSLDYTDQYFGGYDQYALLKNIIVTNESSLDVPKSCMFNSESGIEIYCSTNNITAIDKNANYYLEIKNSDLKLWYQNNKKFDLLDKTGNKVIGNFNIFSINNIIIKVGHDTYYEEIDLSNNKTNYTSKDYKYILDFINDYTVVVDTKTNILILDDKEVQMVKLAKYDSNYLYNSSNINANIINIELYNEQKKHCKLYEYNINTKELSTSEENNCDRIN